MTQQDAFLTSLRGQYIMAQALEVAIDTLGKVEPAYMREESNIADMKFLREKFNFPVADYSTFTDILQKKYPSVPISKGQD